MKKSDAIALFGNHERDVADALNISRQAVLLWPDPLTERLADRVLGAALRQGRLSITDVAKYMDKSAAA